MAWMVCKLPSLSPSTSVALSLQSPDLPCLTRVKKPGKQFSHVQSHFREYVGWTKFPSSSFKGKKGQKWGQRKYLHAHFPPPGLAGPEKWQTKQLIFLMNAVPSSGSLQASPTAQPTESKVLLMPLSHQISQQIMKEDTW